jgi:hypothetical protein
VSANKAKGTRWEVQVRDYLNSRGFDTYRPAQEGFRDTGDLHGLPLFAVQCKDWRDVTGAIREGIDGARVQAGNRGEPFGVAIVKRARKPVAEAYAVLRLEDFASLVQGLDGEEHWVDYGADDGYLCACPVGQDHARPRPA